VSWEDVDSCRSENPMLCGLYKRGLISEKSFREYKRIAKIKKSAAIDVTPKS